MFENIFEFTHKSGLKVIFVPKPGFNERYAMFTTKYGSIDSTLESVKTGEILDVPLGIAHFLEHKLFEQEDGDVMEIYAKMGVRPNAFTSNTQTSYLFSCANNFNKSLELLLKYVQNPYFTEESVEKEKGIIEQEINMYLDNPSSMVYSNLMRGLYVNHSVRHEIIGSVESIGAITPDTLYMLYNTFYTPKNMVLVVVGDEEPSTIESIVNNSILDEWVGREPAGFTAITKDEPDVICEKSIRCEMDVSLPIFMMGYKDNELLCDPVASSKKNLELKFLQEILFGESSFFYDKLYSEGLINDTFFNFYELERSFAFSAFGGESREPERVVERIEQCIYDAKRGDVSESDFKRVKKAAYGEFVRRFNSVEGVCRLYTNGYLADISVVDYFTLYDKINLDGVLSQLKVFDESMKSMSVVM